MLDNLILSFHSYLDQHSRQLTELQKFSIYFSRCRTLHHTFTCEWTYVSLNSLCSSDWFDLLILSLELLHLIYKIEACLGPWHHNPLHAFFRWKFQYNCAPAPLCSSPCQVPEIVGRCTVIVPRVSFWLGYFSFWFFKIKHNDSMVLFPCGVSHVWGHYHPLLCAMYQGIPKQSIGVGGTLLMPHLHFFSPPYPPLFSFVFILGSTVILNSSGF